MGQRQTVIDSDPSIQGDDESLNYKKGNTESISVEENKIINEIMPILTNFYKHATQENYEKITKYDDAFLRCLGWKYRMFTIAAAKKFNLKATFSSEDLKKYEDVLERILMKMNVLMASDLDILWCLYYATGNGFYPNRINDVAHSEIQHVLVRGSAVWSYNSHIRQGMLEASEISFCDSH